MFSNQRVEKFDDRKPEFLHDVADNPRVQQIRGKIRTPTDDGKPVPKMKAYNVRDAHLRGDAATASRSIRR